MVTISTYLFGIQTVFVNADLNGAANILGDFTMELSAANIAEYWRKRLAAESPENSDDARNSIMLWLLGSDLTRFAGLTPKELEIAQKAMEYRWRVLRQRYLGVGREQAYRNLMVRLASVTTIRNKIQTWVSLSRDRQRGVIDVLQEVVQEMLQSDSYIQQQMGLIADATRDKRLRDMLLFASLEEYCLRPVRNQPLLTHRFVNYLRRIQRGGVTQIPGKDVIRLVSDEILTEDTESSLNLLDDEAIAQYQEAQKVEEQQLLRQEVQEKFEEYLLEKVGETAVEWLRLYLEGKSQEEIAKKLNQPIKELYRLREKISYHAVRVFAIKDKPELVENWLSTSLKEDGLGLTPKQWEQLGEKLSPLGQEILNRRKAGDSLAGIGEKLEMKTHKVIGEWTKVYLVAQNLRAQN